VSVFVIAEAGVNHNGSLEIAKKLVKAAKEAGADCVKFQTFNANKLVSKYAKKATYQTENTDTDASQLEMLKKLELSKDEFVQLKKYCDECDIEFMSTAFDIDSIDFLEEIEMNTWKIPSGEITNLPYLMRIAKLNKPLILSTGMSTMEEVEDAIKILTKNNNSNVTVLHCTTEYPTPFEDVNLNAMITMHNKFGVKVGYSDHTQGIEVPIAAVALGAIVIEKHFTLDRDMVGPDHKASLEPAELHAMIQAIRNIETSMGKGIKNPTKLEKENSKVVRKSIVAARKIKQGEEFTEENLMVKRPGEGISPMKWFDVIGKHAKKDFTEEEYIEL